MNGSELLNPGIMDKAAYLLHKFAGPAVEEVGLMIGDRVRVYRIKNLIATAGSFTERIGTAQSSNRSLGSRPGDVAI